MDNLAVKSLVELETIIAEGFETFYQVGQALSQIKTGRLWVGEYTSFDDYCQRRWGRKQASAYQLISAAEIALGLPTLPIRADHVTPLKPLTPENQRLAWQEANMGSANITTKHVAAVATKYQLVEALGANHWLVRQVNDGVITAKHAYEFYKILEKLPDYYRVAIETHKATPMAAVLWRIRALEYDYKDEMQDILRSGWLDTGKVQIPLSDITVRDLDTWVGKLRYEKVITQQLVAGAKQAQGLPIYDGEQCYSLQSDVAYLFPDMSPEAVGKLLSNQGYAIFMVVAYKDNPVVNFSDSEKVALRQVNGVKPEPVMQMIKTLS